jgi:hypothetical protein
MRFSKARNVHVDLPKTALEAVFAECDRYDADETGGRVLGTYEQRAGKLFITVSGIIEPGPAARRSSTSFFQDGAYQEQVFRRVEKRAPTVEHLGNWHTHHMNGLRHLSGGDIETYRRTVEHQNHNTDFFFALLVIEKKQRKSGLGRYVYKTYLFRRGDGDIYEIPGAAITLVDAPLVWPASEDQGPAGLPGDEALRQTRVYDRDILSQFFPHVGPFMSKDIGVYWRGPIDLIDGSKVQVVVVEDTSSTEPGYALTIRNPPPALEHAAKALSKGNFASCRAALIATERTCNGALFNARSPDGER